MTALAKLSGLFDRDYIKLERTVFNDTAWVRWREVRAITGAIGGSERTGPEIIPGACTVFLEGELGFTVNHTVDEVIDMIREKELVQ